MATIIGGRFCGAGIFKTSNKNILQKANQFSTYTSSWSESRKKWLISLGFITSGAGAFLYAVDRSVAASGTQVIPPKLPWSHGGIFQSFDHASIRRGYEVYKTVCASCHSLQYVAYRHLVGVSHTEEEAKAEAAEVMVRDGPDDEGNFFDRPGTLTDYFPSPYANEQAARFANNGANPPDLSLMVLARKGGEDYIFHLLTGYTDPPAGIHLQEGQYYNPYFPGAAIGMAQAIFDETVEFADGTTPSAPQIAKDVVTFLSWTAQQEHDERKLTGLKIIPTLLILIGASYYMKRFVFSTIKTRKIIFVPKRK